MRPEAYLYHWTLVRKNGAPDVTGTPSGNSRAGMPPKTVLVLPFGGGIGSFVGILVVKEIEAGSIVSSREFRSFRKRLNGSRSGHFRKQLKAAVVLQAGAGWNEAAHD